MTGRGEPTPARGRRARAVGRPWIVGIVAILLAVLAGGVWWQLGRSAGTEREAARSRPGRAGAGEVASVASPAMAEQGRTLLRLSQQAGVAVVPVRRMDIVQTVEANGSLAATREQTMRFGVAGRVAVVAVEEGQTVRAGTLLARLDDTDQNRALVQARNDYEAARVELGSAEVEAKRLAYEAARRDLESTRLVAPFNGVVARVDIQPGDQVTAAQEAIWLVDPGSLEAHVSVDEVDLPRVSPGEPVSISVKAFPDLELPGKVERIGVAGRTQGDLVLFDVVVSLDRTDPRLRPGMTVTARIQVQSAQNVLAVPEESVVEVDGRTLVSVVSGSGVTLTPVTLGVSDGRFVEVRSGLQEGDRVLATNYAVYRQMVEASGNTSAPTAQRGANPFSFRVTPGPPFPERGGGQRTGGH